MKQAICILAAMSILAMLCGCAKGRDGITNKNISPEDITEFYYTYENINFNAFYQRYRFYTEGGRHMFYHETREKPGDYGWTTEEDTTDSGTVELTEEEWKQFIELLKDGTISAREDSADSGSSGPWTYIYWKNDKAKYQQYDFASADALKSFEEFCKKLMAAREYIAE